MIDYPLPENVDWDALLAEARRVLPNARAGYSNHPVGAACLGADGHIYVGVNVENCVYAGQHAEWNMIGAAAAAGTEPVAMVCLVGLPGTVATPCMICLQNLYEFGPSILVLTPTGPRRLGGVVASDAFGPATLVANQIHTPDI
jgi:cytidine deaminase